MNAKERVLMQDASLALGENQDADFAQTIRSLVVTIATYSPNSFR